MHSAVIFSGFFGRFRKQRRKHRFTASDPLFGETPNSETGSLQAWWWFGPQAVWMYMYVSTCSLNYYVCFDSMSACLQQTIYEHGFANLSAWAGPGPWPKVKAPEKKNYRQKSPCRKSSCRPSECGVFLYGVICRARHLPMEARGAPTPEEEEEEE